jgi:hypothetical protein
VSPAKTAKVAKTSRKAPLKSPLYEVRRSKIQGRGAFAIRSIRKGQRIDEYLGERISHEEADRRYDDADGRHHTFLFILDDDVVLDARKGGSDARFINHSCDPNCETLIDDGHIYINAIKPIAAETELTYDYRFEWQDEYEPEDVRYYACRCGTAKCRGTILRIPVYLRPTIKRWLAGDDVKRPPNPRTAKKRAAEIARNSADRSTAVKKNGSKRSKTGMKKVVNKRGSKSVTGSMKKTAKKSGTRA